MMLQLNVRTSEAPSEDVFGAVAQSEDVFVSDEMFGTAAPAEDVFILKLLPRTRLVP